MMKKAAALVREFCEQNADSYRFYGDYSGRGMFGRRCVGVAVRNGNSYMSMLIELTRFLCDNDFDDLDLELEGVSTDALGMDTIVYFPNMYEEL